MFGIGGPELVLIVIVALLFVGPDKLPQVARTVGTGLRDLRRAANLAQAELRETLDDLAREVERPPAPAPLTPAQLAAQQAAEDRAAARTAEIANARPPDEPLPDEPLPEAVFDGPPPEGETFAVIPRRHSAGAPAPTLAEPGLAEALAEALPADAGTAPPAVADAVAAEVPTGLAGTRPRSASPLRAGSLAAEAALASHRAIAADLAAQAQATGTTAAPAPAAAPDQDA